MSAQTAAVAQLSPIETVRLMCYAEESALVRSLAEQTGLDNAARARITKHGEELIRALRKSSSSQRFFDLALQEYGLDNQEGISLMRLAEAYARTPDDATKTAIIKDRLSVGDWRAHNGKARALSVNLATRALGFAKTWYGRNRGPIAAIADPIARKLSDASMVILGKHFVLGETIADALRTATKNDGALFSFDMLGEAARTMRDAERYFIAYKNAIIALAPHATDAICQHNSGISVKLSALYPRYEYAHKDAAVDHLTAKLLALITQAKAANIPLTIDAEESERLELSLDILDQVMADATLDDWDGLGFVVQAYQRRADAVLDWLRDASQRHGRRISIRLVKGAYWDREIKRAQELGLSSYPVFTRKAHTDVSYLACARKLIENRDAFYPQFATHNAHTVAAIHEMTRSLKLDLGAFEFQRLHGMGDDLHHHIVKAGYGASRVYAPVGAHRDLLPYLVRRLLENGANSSFINQLYDEATPPHQVARDPVAQARENEFRAHPRIGEPRDQFAGARLAADGIDLDQPLNASAFEALVAADTTHTHNAGPVIINGNVSGKARPIHNPARLNQTVGTIIECDATHAEQAAAEAPSGAAVWNVIPVKARAAIIARAGDLLENERNAFLPLLVREAGKSAADAVAEWREAIDFCRYYANQAAAPAFADHDHHGVIACISPWNFPLAIFLGQVAAALVAGNGVIAKPAEQTPLVAAKAIELLFNAGVPREALQFLPGPGETVGAALVRNPNISGILFTGSTQTARLINRDFRRHSGHDAPFIAETGGVNAMIVDSSALIEQAVDDVIASAFQSAGQRCSALRLVCVQDEIADDFCTMLAGAMALLNAGDPAQLKTDTGPLIDADAKATIDAYVEKLREHAHVIAEAPLADDNANGFFVRPIAFEIENVRALQQEVFGPVLHVARFKAGEIGAVIDTINEAGYGLTFGIHTRLDAHVNLAATRICAGNIYVNRNQIGAVVGVQPFGGENLSGTGPKAGGPHYLEHLSRAPDNNGDDNAEPAAFLNSDETAYPPGNAPDILENEIITGAGNALDAIADPQTRLSLLLQAEDTLSSTFPELARQLADTASSIRHAFVDRTTLPGPVGETNDLWLKPRGVLLCLGDDIIAQTLAAFVAGNAVVTFPPEKNYTQMDALIRALTDAGMPAQAITLTDRASAQNAIRHPGLAGIVYDGPQSTRQSLLTQLAQRNGPIVPLLSYRDPHHRFAFERVLTINLAAAGGDAALLSLEDDDPHWP